MFEAAEAFDVRFLEYFARLGRRYVMSLEHSDEVPSKENLEMAKIKVEQAMREIVDGQSQFAETFINAAYEDEPGTVVFGLGMTVWASAGPLLEDNLRAQGRKIVEQAQNKRPNNRFLLRALHIIAKSDRNFPLAHKCLDQMLRIDPNDIEAVVDKIELFQIQEDFNKAASMLQKAGQRFRGSALLANVQQGFSRNSKRCPRCGNYMRYAAPFCAKCKNSFM